MSNPDVVPFLLDTAQLLIEEAMQKISEVDPEKHTAIIEFARAGAIPRLTIETHPGFTTVSLTLNGGGGGVHVFQFRLERAQTWLH